MAKKIPAVIIFFVSCVAVLLRLWQLSNQSYWIDESYSIALAKSIWLHGFPITESGGFITRSVLYHYFLAGFLAAPRLPAVIFGLLSIVVVAAVAQELFSRRIAFITTGLMALSYWEIAWSRQARMYTALQFFVWLTVYCYLRWRKQACWQWGMATVLAGVVSVTTHEFGILVVVLIGLHFASERLKSPVMYGLIMISCVLAAIVGMKVLGQTAPVNYWFHYWYYLGTTLPVTITLAGLALTKRSAAWLAASVVVIIGIFSFAVALLEYRYLFFMLPAIFILAAISLDQLWRHWKVLFFLVICLAIWHRELVVWPHTRYYLESDSVSSPFNYKSITPQPDFASAYQFIESFLQPGDTVITPYPTLQRLYAPQMAMRCLYIDLIGQAPLPPTAAERYTACPYFTAHTLQQELATGHGFIILDQFAEGRIQPDLLDIIQHTAQSVYPSQSQVWSQLSIYKY